MTAPKRSRKAFWAKQLHQWHWISSAICLVAMMLFSLTGITLNHADDITSAPITTRQQAVLPAALMAQLDTPPNTAKAPLPPALHDWLRQTFGLSMSRTHEAEWSDTEVYLSLPRPGGDAWVSLNLDTAQAEYQHTRRGWVATLNDLHKGRNTGPVWAWFIDIFAVTTLLFCLTGLLLLQLHSKHRRSTWPIVIGGFLIPLLLAVFFIH